MSKTNVNRLYGKGVYLKVAVPKTQEVETNIIYFKQAIIIIGEGQEKIGRKRLKTKYICSCGQDNPMFLPLFLSSGMVYLPPSSIHNTHTIFSG